MTGQASQRIFSPTCFAPGSCVSKRSASSLIAVPPPCLIAASTRVGVAGTVVTSTPVAWRMALRIAGAVGISTCSPSPLAPNGPSGSGTSIRIDLDRRHVADGRDQIVVQVLGAAGDVLLHQRHADALRDAALDLAFDQQRVDRLADIVRGGDLDQLHRAELACRPRVRRSARHSHRRHRACPGPWRRAARSADRRSRSPRTRSRRHRPASAARSMRLRCSPSRTTSDRAVEGKLGRVPRRWRSAGSFRAARAPAFSAALPETKVCRDAEVLPASGVIAGVARSSAGMLPSGRPSASAQICAITVFEPWPISTAP